MVEVLDEEHNIGFHDGDNMYSISNNSNWNTCFTMRVKRLVSNENERNLEGERRE